MCNSLDQPRFEDDDRIRDLFDHMTKDRFKDLFCRGNRSQLENIDMNFACVEHILNLTCSTLLHETGDKPAIIPADVFFAVFGLLIPLPIIVGNLLIILVFGWHLPREQRHSDVFVINMAVADLLVGLLMPFDATFHIETVSASASMRVSRGWHGWWWLWVSHFWVFSQYHWIGLLLFFTPWSTPDMWTENG